MNIKVEIHTRNTNSPDLITGYFCALPPSLERDISNDPSILPHLLAFTANVAKCALSGSGRQFSSANLILSTDPV